MNWSEKNQDMAGTQAAMVRATRKALHEAKLRGEKIPQWRNGKVIWVEPNDLPSLPEQTPREGQRE